MQLTKIFSYQLYPSYVSAESSAPSTVVADPTSTPLGATAQDVPSATVPSSQEAIVEPEKANHSEISQKSTVDTEKDRLGRIASLVGDLKVLHPETVSKTNLEVAKVLTLIDPRKPLPETVNAQFENGVVARIVVSSPWMPEVCTHCKEIGHSIRRCKLAPKSCSACKCPGHSLENCPKNRKVDPPVKKQKPPPPKTPSKHTHIYVQKAGPPVPLLASNVILAPHENETILEEGEVLEAECKWKLLAEAEESFFCERSHITCFSAGDSGLNLRETFIAIRLSTSQTF
ncbi:hypothetical protein DY000_02047282 [Brassica cretica]|uniref:CCHC-type domain-containing protein n=1 Tax=Brassica cretica TaxID=69181 RepID=A0ABQ7EWE4_BRACR|nr:hypothetical protein DY000_02047282 [Brassica cretica]